MNDDDRPWLWVNVVCTLCGEIVDRIRAGEVTTTTHMQDEHPGEAT